MPTTFVMILDAFDYQCSLEMVCKEEVLLWFKDLDGYKRIDVLYELLNMCLPFELRFIGSCIEELGKHTYQELRGPTLTANDLEKLSKDVSFNQGILDENVRHRVLVYLSLLSSRNYSVANWLYKKVLRTDHIEDYLVKEKGKDEVLHSEFLLLYTMVLHHPAFTFEQKQYFSKVLAQLIDFREKRVSAKHCALGYPPGFGYPTHKIQDVPTVPVKAAPTLCGDAPSTFQHPPGLTHLPPPPHIDFIAPMWNRPGFPYGAPEVGCRRSPPPSISPLVSQAASPSQSRSTSPHRTTMNIRPPAPPQVLQPPIGPPPTIPLNGPPPPMDIMPVSVQPPLPPDQLSQSSLPMYNNPDLKLAEEDLAKLSSIAEDKHLIWAQQVAPLNPEVKPNGIRFPHFPGNFKPAPFLVEQMQALSLDGENSLHQSNSSSNSSPNGTPPGTPSNTPAATPHGPGRGDKSRANGMPQFGGAPIHNTTPPPPPVFSSSSVPYSFPQAFTALPPNNRSMFHYTQAYRPTFTPQYQNYPTDNSFPTYTYPYMSLIISSQYPPRTPTGCYNCGALNHMGTECPNQNIEEITQKKTYQLEYTSPLPDPEK
ncbi:hypothetical protein NQ315_015742 [Exocentrus adspersus]|uniref:CCHC-type domain-containing protein n=1 Tax=Exocentrus adspersus TaxID=1586481 RepID=A0AAV8W381_9CUCU|nr:hypothetical protein NQ315_015742 [Exocentrus adspersus]